MRISIFFILILNTHGACTSAEEEFTGCSLCNMASYCEDGGNCYDVQDGTYQKWSDGIDRHR